MQKANITWNGAQIAKMYNNQSFRFDNAIQRGIVWDIKKKSLFIDSLLRDYPVPPIYTIKTDETVQTSKGIVNVYDCIDGKQRLTSLSQFKNNEFQLAGLDPISFNGEELDINGLTFSELPSDLQDEINGSAFTVYFFTEISELEIREVMDRLNNGKPLSGVEKARIKSKDLPSVMELASHELFGEFLSEKAILGYANEDIVIKAYIQTFENEEDLTFENRKVHDIYMNHEFTDDEKNRLTSLFDKTREVIEYIENKAENKEIAKRIYGKVIRKTNLLSVMAYIGGLKDDVDTCDVIADKIIAFFSTKEGLSESEEYNEASTNATMRGSNVKIRIRAITEFCEKM